MTRTKALRLARMLIASPRQTVPRGVPMVWVSHRCLGMHGRIVLWESA